MSVNYEKLKNPGFNPKKFFREPKKLYSKSVDSNGNSIFFVRSEVDEYEEIQSFKDQCSLATILSKMAYVPADQIVSSLSVNNGYSADISRIPTDLNDYFDLYSDLERKIPNFAEKVKTMSFKDIVSDYIGSLVSIPDNSNNNESEDNSNGSNE